MHAMGAFLGYMGLIESQTAAEMATFFLARWIFSRRLAAINRKSPVLKETGEKDLCGRIEKQGRNHQRDRLFVSLEEAVQEGAA